METKLLFLHALSPLHAGTGQGVGAIDLPIAREKATGIPIVPGSSIKGVFRGNYEQDDITAIFGPETDRASDHAGSVQFSDARLFFLPVRSLSGTFAWVTSPLLLQRFKRDVTIANSGLSVDVIPQIASPNQCLVADNGSDITFNHGRRVVLEDLDFQAEPSAEITQWATHLTPQIFADDAAWGELFQKRICLVHDDVLSYLLDTATEVTARIQLESNKKTVKRGALWYEEALPAESILVGIVVAQPPAAVGLTPKAAMDAIQTMEGSLLQVGGSITVGRGLCRINLV